MTTLPYIWAASNMLVFIQPVHIDYVIDILRELLPDYVIPYWYPDDAKRTMLAARVILGALPAECRLGIMAIGKDQDLLEFIEESSNYHDIIVLTPDNLGDHPEKTLYELGALGMFRTGQKFHIACGTAPTEATLTYGSDFTDLRVDEVKAWNAKLLETPLKLSTTPNSDDS